MFLDRYLDVWFEDYCWLCKYYDADVEEDPCQLCLINEINVNSHRPVYFEGGENYDEFREEIERAEAFT